MEPKIYYLLEKEIHQFNFYVSVVWNTREHVDREGGRRIVTQVRDGEPYIGFPWIRGEGDDVWIDDDKTISGGLTADQAEEVARGLLAAAAYIRSLTEPASPGPEGE